LPERAAVDNVPFYPQEKYYCGPASLAMALTSAGIPADQDEIARQVYTPGRKGTLPVDIMNGARRNGALAIEVRSLRNLLAEISAGNPVLVFQNLGLKIIPQWHFAIVTGYDLEKEIITLHSGLDPDKLTDMHAFERTWERAGNWAITVTSPDDIPVSASEMDALKAAANLERSENYLAAVSAYRAITGRWPQNVIARIGLGNTEYKLNRFAEAETAFRDALLINDRNAAAWNNLANALARQGRNEEAMQAARKAVTLGGDNSEIYKNTLNEISAGKL
jgi:tetratricopeptide (TPR) repeat protein